MLADAARPLFAFRLFRSAGASLLIPGVAGTTLGRNFAEPAAYGDLIATGFAWIAIAMPNRIGGVIVLWILTFGA